MNYKELYDNLIDYRKTNVLDYESGKTETHHIIPRCLGGNDENSNLIILTTKEHLEAHYYLAKIYNEHIGISIAFMLMANTREILLTEEMLEQYEISRLLFSENHFSQSEEWRKEHSEKMKKIVESGNHHFTDEEFKRLDNIRKQKRIEDGTHNFITNNPAKTSWWKEHKSNLENEKIKNKTHHFITNHPAKTDEFKEIQSKKQNELLEKGEHNFQKEENRQKLMDYNNNAIANGTHHFITNNPNIQKMKDGNHHFLTNNPNSIRVTCEYCGHITNKTCIARFHKDGKCLTKKKRK